MSLKYNHNNNTNKPYNNYPNPSYNHHYGPSPPHGYKYDIYHNNINYPMKKVHGGYAHHMKNAPFPPTGPSYRYPPAFGGFDDYNKSYNNKYSKRNYPTDEKMMSSCSTGSSEEDNNNQKQKQQKVTLRYQQQELDFVVYQNSAPVYEGEPTEKDTETLMYTFIGKHSDKFVCSDLKAGPKPAEAFPMPSFLD